jgi:acyl-CoA thioesterase
MTTIRQFAQDDAFAKLLGIELLDVSAGRAKARLTISAKHLNGHHTAHGGAIFSLADFVFAAAANSYGTVAVAINVNISYFNAVSEGTLTAEAREISCNPKLATYSIPVTDERGELVALFQGMAYRKKTSI